MGSDDVLFALNTIIDQTGLILKPEIIAYQARGPQNEVWKTDKVKKEPVTKKRTMCSAELELMMTWINIHNPSGIVACSWCNQGVDIGGEKGAGKVLAYAKKYFLLKLFNTATDDDDSDKYQREQSKNTTTIERQIDMLNALINRVAEPVGQEFEAAKSLVINDFGLNPEKAFKGYGAYDYGAIPKLSVKWINFYESRQKIQENKK